MGMGIDDGDDRVEPHRALEEVPSTRAPLYLRFVPDLITNPNPNSTLFPPHFFLPFWQMERLLVHQLAGEEARGGGIVEKDRRALVDEGRRTPRQHMNVMQGDQAVGEVTSGCLSPTLGYPIAMAYVDSAQAAVGTNLTIDFGKQTVAAEIVPLPFYKHG